MVAQIASKMLDGHVMQQVQRFANYVEMVKKRVLKLVMMEMLLQEMDVVLYVLQKQGGHVMERPQIYVTIVEMEKNNKLSNVMMEMPQQVMDVQTV